MTAFSQHPILCGVIEPLGINLFREMVAFPGNGTLECFYQIDALTVAEFLADTARIDHDVLSRVDAPAQFLGHALSGLNDDAPVPVGSLCDLFDTLGYTEGKWLTGVVDAPTGSLVDHSQGDGAGDVLYVPMSPAPVGLPFFQQNGLSPIKHAFEIGKHTVLGIVWSVDCRQAQNGAEEFGVVHNNALSRDFVIVIHPGLGIILCPERLAAIWVELFTQARVLGNRQGIDLAIFVPVDSPKSPVNVLAAENDNAPGHACEGRHQVACVPLMPDYHIQYDFGFQPLQVTGIFPQAITISQNLFHALWTFSPCLSTMKDAHLVSCCAQIIDDIWSHKVGASNDQNAHSWFLSGVSTCASSDTIHALGRENKREAML